MKIYCRKCGSGTEYTLQKPKFCSSCGGSFSGTVSNASTPQSAPRPVAKEKITSLDFEIETDNSTPDISQLEYELEKPKAKKITLADIAGTSENEQVIDRPKFYTRKSTSKKQILEDFRKEAGQSRESTEV